MRWLPLIIISLFMSLLVMARLAEFVPVEWWPSNEPQRAEDRGGTPDIQRSSDSIYRIQALTWFDTGNRYAAKRVQIVRMHMAGETASEQPIFFHIAACVIEPGSGSLPGTTADSYVPD